MAKKIKSSVSFSAEIEPSLIHNTNWSKIFVGHGLAPSEVITMGLKADFRHICHDDHPYFQEEINVAAYLSSNKSEFLKYPIASILYPHCVSHENEKKNLILNINFQTAEDKTKLLAEVERALLKLKISNSIMSDGIIICDELFTNALYNAPFVDLSNKSSGAPRNKKDVKMHDGKTGRLFMAASESRIIIGCSDPYGTLNLKKYLERIRRCYEEGIARNINMSGNGGAGIGSFMIFNVVDSLYVHVHEKNQTMICCSLPRLMSSKSRDRLSKNLHFEIKK